MKFLTGLILLFFLQQTIYEGTIIKVIDGDTFVLQTESGSIKVRMEGIDCPALRLRSVTGILALKLLLF